MNVMIREAVEQDIDSLKGRLREADAQEILAAGSESAEAALADSFARSASSYTVELDGIPVAMFGVVEDARLLPGSTLMAPDKSANIWLLGTPELGQIKKTFVRVSRQVIVEYLAKYRILWNVVDARYSKTIRWLVSCGAEFGSSIDINGFEFISFVIRRA